LVVGFVRREQCGYVLLNDEDDRRKRRRRSGRGEERRGEEMSGLNSF